MLNLNIDKFKELQKQKKLNMTDMSKLIGITRSHLWRLLSGQCKPGEKFIAGFKRAFPDEDFNLFFFFFLLHKSDN